MGDEKRGSYSLTRGRQESACGVSPRSEQQGQHRADTWKCGLPHGSVVRRARGWGKQGKVCQTLWVKSSEMSLTLMPSNRDRARSGRRARRVRRALMDATSEYSRILAMRLVREIWCRQRAEHYSGVLERQPLERESTSIPRLPGPALSV